MTALESALAGLWLMLPALIPNTAAVLLGGGTPMDFGKTWRGRRIFGDGKTWRGFLGGALAGVAFGAFQIAAVSTLDAEQQRIWGFGEWPWSFYAVLALGFGSMLGDCLGSFTKRRFGVERGAKAPILDQYNFVLGAAVLVMLVRPGWFLNHYFDGNSILGLALLLIVVPFLHRGINIIGYKLGKKNVPW